MSDELYPELRGLTVPADALMEYVLANHRHDMTVPDGDPFVWSRPLDRWIREHARVADPEAVMPRYHGELHREGISVYSGFIGTDRRESVITLSKTPD